MKLLTHNFYSLFPLILRWIEMLDGTNETKKSKVSGTAFWYKYFIEHQAKAI